MTIHQKLDHIINSMFVVSGTPISDFDIKGFGNTYNTTNSISYMASKDCYVIAFTCANGNSSIVSINSTGSVIRELSNSVDNGCTYSKYNRAILGLYRLNAGEQIIINGTGTYDGASNLGYMVLYI